TWSGAPPIAVPQLSAVAPTDAWLISILSDEAVRLIPGTPVRVAPEIIEEIAVHLRASVAAAGRRTAIAIVPLAIEKPVPLTQRKRLSTVTESVVSPAPVRT